MYVALDHSYTYWVNNPVSVSVYLLISITVQRPIKTLLRNMTSGWPYMIWSRQYITFRWRVLPTKFGSHKPFLSHLTPGWPRLTPTWPLTPALHYKLNCHRAFTSHLIHGWPWLTSAWPLTQQCLTFRSEVLPTKSGGFRAFLRQLDLWMTFDL